MQTDISAIFGRVVAKCLQLMVILHNIPRLNSSNNAIDEIFYS
jgi:hypothetical protein